MGEIWEKWGVTGELGVTGKGIPRHLATTQGGAKGQRGNRTGG